ncbi:MAG: PIG-L family deacetylase [Gemmatimonadales bacterium]
MLVLGAHPDDIEIGGGGTILRLLAARPELEVRWEVFSGAGERRSEAEASAAAFLGGSARAAVVVHGFRDGFVPHQPAIKERFVTIRSAFVPDLILTHQRDDRHQDHRVLAELTWNTFRRHLVLEYEIPKYDGELAPPNLFVPLTGAIVDRKVELLMRHFGSQQSRSWFTADTFRALARLRGVESAAPDGFAEGFLSRKATLAL